MRKSASALRINAVHRQYREASNGDLRDSVDLSYSVDVKDVTTANFGLLIAYVIPGFILLWGLEPHSATLQNWLTESTSESATVAGFLYVTVVSVGLGMLCSTIRWLVVDRLHHTTGVKEPRWNFRDLDNPVAVHEWFIEIHYRYYQWHANSLVALNMAFGLRWASHGLSFSGLTLAVALNALLYLGSRDTLTKYYRRVDQVLR